MYLEYPVLFLHISSSEVCAQCPVWLFSVVVILSRFIAQTYCKRIWDGPVFPYYYLYHSSFYMSHTLYFYCKFFIFQDFLSFFLDRIPVS